MLVWLAGAFIFMTFGQDRKIRKANEKYNNYGYIDAAEIYEDVLSSGYVSAEILQKLGNTYYFNANYEKAEEYYEQLFSLEKGENLSPEYYLRYSQSLRALGNQSDAEKWFDMYADKVDLSGSLASAIDYMELIEKNSGRYQIKNLDINTEGIDFGGSTHNGRLVYASTRDTGVFMKRRSAWDGLSFLDLYGIQIEETDLTQLDQISGDSDKISGSVNTKFHESSACFTKDGKTMYFTRNNVSPEELSKKEAQKLKIYRATLKEGEWTDIEDLSINSDYYSNAHPTLSVDERKLYFASDRSSTRGQTDIYVVSIDEEGVLGTPKNMGDKINTAGKETFPFVSNNNELYFSSDGHFGLGGLDVFYIQLDNPDSEDGLGNLLNIGKPINSSADDFAFTIDVDTKKGFFSSNRETNESKGYDDIYSFLEEEKIKDLLETIIYGKVIDKETQEPIALAKIEILNAKNEVLKEVKTDSLGEYKVNVDRYKNYLVRASEKKYDTDEKPVETKEEKTEVNFELQRNQITLEPGKDLAKVLNIPIIYFDFDKSNIREDAAIELQKVIAAMKKYPNLKIDIRSHTDSRGSDTYNKALSERRAKSTRAYIISKGISADRLTAKGYGESRLVNNCSNGVPCSKEKHQANRRSEFVIVE